MFCNSRAPCSPHPIGERHPLTLAFVMTGMQWEQDVQPGARLMAHLTSVDRRHLLAMEVAVCGAVEWRLLVDADVLPSVPDEDWSMAFEL